MNSETATHAPLRTTGRRSVLFRLLAVAVGAVFTVHLAGAFVVAKATFESAERMLDEHLTTSIDSRAKLMAAPLWKLQYEDVAALLDEILNNESIVSAAVYDDSGAIVAGKPAKSGDEATILRTEAIVYRDGNIRAQAGRLDVAITRAPIVAAYWKSLWHALLVSTLATVAIAIGIWLATQLYVGRPLHLMAAAIDRSRQSGRRHRVAWNGNDEFGAVAQAFNAMQDAAERDESALLAANRRLDFLALHDVLTGLPNRRAFEDRLRLAASAERTATFAVHFIDLDGFKAVNDTLGHAAGDQLLRHVGRQLELGAGQDNFVARFGGDEFVVLQTSVSGSAAAVAFADQLMAVIKLPCLFDGNTIQAEASIGVAVMDDKLADATQLLSLADIALYEAKRERRGTVSLLTNDEHDRHNRRRRLEADIKASNGWQHFMLFFQPQVDIQSGRPIGLEALVRWHHPEYGLLSPIEFLPLVDEMGLGSSLGTHIIKEACRAARQLLDRGQADLRIAINLSSAQIVDPNLVKLFAEQIAQLQLPADALEVEITEVALIRDPINAKAVLSGLRQLGISIALDDFGTGYSSLAYLRRFPIDRIKLDRSFVQELPEIAETVAIVRAIRDLSQSLGIELVAEGIERKAEADFLLGEGIKLAQGYLYCKPHPLAQICVWLDKQRKAKSKAA